MRELWAEAFRVRQRSARIKEFGQELEHFPIRRRVGCDFQRTRDVGSWMVFGICVCVCKVYPCMTMSKGVGIIHT